MYQYPSTSVTWSNKGDTTLASRYRGDGSKLLYELKNGMKFNRLGMNKMTRIFTDGTVITAMSHFGHDMVQIDVTGTTLAGAVLPCVITLIDLPDAIPPMKYAGEIHAGEVEGIDYIKTYYIVDKSNCVKCSDNPDSNICTTAKLAEDETLCIPFTFVDTSVESKVGEPNNHCLEPSEHCQAEVISFGQDGGGTYFIWKAYTEWPPDNASGYGFMQMKGFFKLDGKLDNECETIPVVIEVNCCEKNSDEYKAVHTEDWGDLDIEYTSLVMGCDEEQTLTAKYGCPPFTWTLTSGGGTLTPAEDRLTALYESPETNPNCVDNPIITLEDRCEQSKELKLAVNCYLGHIPITDVAYKQTTYDYYTPWGPYGGRSGPRCRHKVSWYDCDGTLNSSPYNPCEGGLISLCSSDQECTDITPGFCGFYGVIFCSITSPAPCDSWPDPDDPYICWRCYNRTNWNEWEGPGNWGPPKSCDDCTGEDELDYYGHHCDHRTQVLKDAGCCPINPETGLPY